MRDLASIARINAQAEQYEADQSRRAMARARMFAARSMRSGHVIPLDRAHETAARFRAINALALLARVGGSLRPDAEVVQLRRGFFADSTPSIDPKSARELTNWLQTLGIEKVEVSVHAPPDPLAWDGIHHQTWEEHDDLARSRKNDNKTRKFTAWSRDPKHRIPGQVYWAVGY